MTKEETLNKSYRRRLTYDEGKIDDNAIFPVTHSATVYAAMDTYARQEAMEYCRWIKMVAYYMPAKERWYFFPNDPLYNKEGHTDDEMYDLYQQQKQKR